MCSVQARTQLDIGGEKSTPGAHVKHYFIAVTLDVSKLSGWLNTDAPCRAQQKGGHSRIQL